MNFFQFIFQDWKANKWSAKGRAFLLFFRIANFCNTRRLYFYLGFPYIIIYKILIQWIFTLEIPWNVQIGRNLTLNHGQALVLNNEVIIGHSCTLRHCTTIGVKENLDGTTGKAPVIGNYVNVGSNVCIIGDITIGDNVKIGSGSVVVKSAPANCVIAGNPAVVKKMLEPANSAEYSLRDNNG